MSTKVFFSYDPTGNGFEEHESAEEARDECQRNLDSALQDDFQGDDIMFICWGEIKGKVIMRNKREPTLEERTAFGWSFVADVTLENV